tara:strand:- start:15934 stop:16188 length:255 start_codon:yes stop_codon:yes gene_type:complete
MADYDNRLSGAIFKNDKGDNPKRPDYKGSYTDGDGNEFWVSAWIKDSQKGDKFMSLSMQPKEAQGKQDAKPASNFSSDDDKLPF